MIWSRVFAVHAAAGIFVLAGIGVRAQQAPPPSASCTITGTISGLGGPLPGVSITVRSGDTVRTAASTGIDGKFKVALPDASYQLTAELFGFDSNHKDLTVSRDTCAQTVDLTLTLTPRVASATPAAGPSTGRGGRAGAVGPRAGGAPAANETAEAAAQRRFESLAVNENEATRTLDRSAFEAEADPSSLTPLGFGAEALADAFAVTGEAARVDRGLLNDRRGAEFQGPNFDPRNIPGGFEGIAAQLQGRGGNIDAAALAQLLGRGGNVDPAAIAELLGRGGFDGGRGGRGGAGGRGGNPNFRQGQRIQGNATYTFSGSALNSAPQQLRSELKGVEPRNANHNYNFSAQLPVKIPGIYKDTNNRTTLTVTYTGRTGTNPFDQYATVPTDAMRAGDFSSVSTPLIDPSTGQPFTGNQIPLDRISPQALALLQYYPAPTLDGTTRNYHRATTNFSRTNNVTLRLNHNFTPQAGGRGGRGGQQGGGGRGAPQAGRGGQQANGRGRGANSRLNVTMNLNIQYSQQDNDQLNVFSSLGGTRQSRNYSVSPNFNIQHGRNQFQVSNNYNHTSSSSINNFSGVNNVSNAIGIQGVSDSSFAWGLPRLSFSSITGLSDLNPQRSIGDRIGTNVTWRRPFGRHQIQSGGTFNYDKSTTNNESNANGQFVFTGIYTGNGSALGGKTGFDFADFLLGMPQQATIAYGPGETTLTGRDLGLFVQDEWRARGNLTFNLGVRWDLRYPFVEEHGHLVNLDVNSDFTGAAPVESGAEGVFSGSFPRALIEKDTNNVSPRLSAAWRGPGQIQYRGSWEIQYNDNTYSGIARRLAQQPPFATTGTNIGGLSQALLMENALAGININETRNNYGIDRDYVVGTARQAVVGVQRQLFRTYQVSAQYGHTIGSNLEIVRAPNRDADGLRIEGVQPFTWTSSEGRSTLDSATIELRKNESRGLQYQVSYTRARSRDNSPSLSGGGGGGGTGNVAQDDQNVDAEWARSSFIQRDRLTLSANYRFPFGPNERWLSNGGFFAGIAGGWRVSANFSANSGSPQTVTVSGAARDIASGVNGALRADYNGEAVSIANPSIDQWFNTDAFTVPGAGAFGSAPRNIITGPGSKNLNMTFNRQVQLRGNRNLQISMQLNNILNLANYSGVDTNVNSPTFGQIRGVNGQRTGTLNLRFGF
jgi:trimeric autotransporter adhesin